MPVNVEFAWAADPQSLEPRVLRAIAEVKRYQGVDLSVTKMSKSLNKFGHLHDVDNTEYRELWTLGASNSPNRPTTNALVSIASSNTNDTELIYIEGHTIASGQLTFVIQTVTLQGTTETTLSTPLARVTRMINRGTAVLLGDIYVWDGSADTDGVPDTLATVGGHIEAGGQQTSQAFTSIEKDLYWFVTELDASVNRAQAAAVDIDLEIRDVANNGVWLPTHSEIALHTTGSTSYHAELAPVLVVGPNHDVRVTARGSSATATSVSAHFGGYLARIV